MKLLAHEAKYELLAAWRNPRARFFTVIFPVVLMVVFGSAFHGTTTVNGASVSLTRFFVPSVLTLSLITASYATLVISMANARESGILKRRRATPVTASALVGGKAVATLVTAVGMTALLLVVAQAGYGVGFSPGALVAIAAAALVGTLALSCVGYAVSGLIGNADAAQPIVQATLLPLYFISGVWIPTDQLPSGLQHIAALFPIEHLANALHLASVHGTLSGAFAAKDLLVLAAWAVGAAIFAARRFSWLPSTAAA